MDERHTILIVDDDPDIRSVVRFLLEARGFTVLEARDGLEALETVAAERDIDLIILDIMMPGLDGYQVCENLRSISNAPVLFLTAKTGETDCLEAIARGGDGFLGKPFSQSMLLAQVSALLRRYTEYKGKSPSSAELSGISLDAAAHVARKDGVPLDLTDTEYNILARLLASRGSAVSAQDLYTSIWNEKYLPSSANTVMVHILNLRKKIEDDASSPKIIRTVWGKGYQID